MVYSPILYKFSDNDGNKIHIEVNKFTYDSEGIFLKSITGAL